MAIDDALNRSPRKNSFGDAAAAMSDPNVTQVQTAPAPKAVQAPAQSAAAQMAALPGSQTSASISPTNIFPQGHPSAGRSPYASAPAAAAPEAPGNPASPSALYMQDRAREMKSQLGAGNYAGAAGTGVRTAIQGLGMYGIEVADKIATPALNAAAGFGRGLFGSEAQAAPVPAQAPGAVSNPTAKPADARVDSGTQAVPAAPSPAAPTQAPSAEPNAIMPGVYQHGRGQYSDQAGGMGFPAGFTGKPNAQNMAAADALAGRQQQESMGRVTAAQQLTAPNMNVSAPTVAHSGNDWQARMDLRKAQVSASSIMNNGGRWDQHKGVSPERAYAAAMEGADIAARGAQAGMNQEAMRQNAGLQREGMQQAGSTARAKMQELGQNSRFGQTQGLAQQKFGMEREAQGFQTRAALQQEQLRNQIMQEQDPTKRQSAVQRMRDLQGQTQPSEWGVQVTPTTKNVDGSTAEGSVIRYNKSTGQVERVETGQGGAKVSSPEQLAALPSGTVYVGPDGKQYRKN